MRALSSLVHGIVWLVIAVVLALGAGGVAAAADRPPGDATRPELTARADRDVNDRLDALRDEVDAIDADVEALSEEGRGALVALAARDVEALAARLENGNAIVARVTENTGRVRAALADLPYPADSARLGERTRARIAALTELADAAQPLDETWRTLATRSAPAVQLIGLLEEHDRHTVAAARLGTQERYADALVELEASELALERADGVRDTLAQTADVSTLDQWLERSRLYDAALTDLYTILVESEGEFTPEAREAFEDVQRAQQLLPPDTRGLVVIMADIAQGGLNQTVIAVELARGTVADARAALD